MLCSACIWKVRSFLYLVSVRNENAPMLATAGTSVVSVQNSVFSWSPTLIAGSALSVAHWHADT
jgi:xanthosine utilization system XapX-like protein